MAVRIRKRQWRSKPGGPMDRHAWLIDYSYYDPDKGKDVRTQATFKTRKEAQAARIEIEGGQAKGTHTPDNISKTVAEAGKIWIEQSQQDGLEPSSIKQYEQHLKLHIEPFLGTMKLSRLKAPMVNTFIRKLREDGRSEAMSRKVRTSLVSIINTAIDEGWVAENVAVRRRRKKLPQRHKKSLPKR